MIRLSYLNSDGSPGSVVLPESVAAIYARSVKNPVLEPVSEASEVEVECCPEGSQEAQRAASKLYHVRGVVGAREPEGDPAEQAAEQMSEHFAGRVGRGQSMDDCWKEWDNR